MGERVTISYRGAAYELGRGKSSYGIWAVGAPRTEPVERWPETPEGWNAAWSRFTTIETPGTIVAASPRGGSLTVEVSASVGVAAALLGIGILCGVVSLFPGYVAGNSLASQPVQLVPHVIYLAAWTLSAALILLGAARLRAGALLGLGVSVVTFGFFLTDIGEVIAGSAMNAGLWFGLIGWLACAAGSVLAFRLATGRLAMGRLGMGRAGKDGAAAGYDGAAAGQDGAAAGQDRAAAGGPGRLGGYDVGRAVLLILAGVGAVVAFAPSWDSYVLHAPNGFFRTSTAGYAFASPGSVIAGNLVVMIVFGLTVIAAAAWRPVRMGAMLLAGAVIPMAAQAISAVVQIGEATPPEQFGIPSSQASAAGLTITNGLTSAFWIYCLLLVVLVVSCAWMLLSPPAPAAVATAPTGMPAPSPSWDEADKTNKAEETDNTGTGTTSWDAEGDETGKVTEPHAVAGTEEAADSVDFGKPAGKPAG
jgi:hypothetical protein